MNKTVIALMNEVEMALGSNYEVRCGEIEKEKNKKKIMIIVHEKENDDTTAFEVNQLVECIKNGRFSVKKAAEKLVGGGTHPSGPILAICHNYHSRAKGMLLLCVHFRL